MGYKCKHSHKDCDCCGECGRPHVCDDCGAEADNLFKTEVGWLCYDCFIKYIEEEN